MAIVSIASSLGVETIETRETIGTRNVAGLDAAPNLSAFSAMVHMISGDSHKLFLSLGIGDGAFPKSAKKRQKAPFKMVQFTVVVAPQKRDKRTHQRRH
jgi:hypothetical protein